MEAESGQHLSVSTSRFTNVSSAELDEVTQLQISATVADICN